MKAWSLKTYRKFVYGCREKVTVHAKKTNLILLGQGYLNTAIAWNDTANSTGGTVYSASVAIFASNFIAYNISFKVLKNPCFICQDSRVKLYVASS
jgi:hypothetical protein